MVRFLICSASLSAWIAQLLYHTHLFEADADAVILFSYVHAVAANALCTSLWWFQARHALQAHGYGLSNGSCTALDGLGPVLDGYTVIWTFLCLFLVSYPYFIEGRGSRVFLSPFFSVALAFI